LAAAITFSEASCAITTSLTPAEDVSFTVEEIEKQVYFQEQYFKSEIRM
jgi:hypothetical protein